MIYYYLVIVWTGLFALLHKSMNMEKHELVCGEDCRRTKVAWAVFVFVPIIVWCGYRGYIGDTGAYLSSYSSMPSSFSGLSEYYGTINKDKGFFIFSAIIKCIIKSRPELYLIIIALVQCSLLMYVYRKFSDKYFLTVFLFFVSTDYLSWLFNGIRQFLAVTITFACFELIIKKKYVPCILIILFASLFHKSALLLLPFIFIVQGKAWNKKTLLFIFGVVVAIAFTDRFTGLLDSMLEDTQYSNVVSDWQSWDDDGTNILRVLVYSIPTVLSLIGRRKIVRSEDRRINICVNMSIVSTGLYIISMFSSGIFIGRLPIYFSLYNYILLPWEVDNVFSKSTAKVINVAMILFYLLFYYYSINFTMSL